MICPNCSAGEISPLTHRCELCGFVPEATVAVSAPRPEALDEVARAELGERFRLDEFLGGSRTGTTAVYLAREQGSTRQLVVKVMARPAELRAETDDRFRRAVESVATLEHPHLVPVFEHGWTEHLYWYSMEHVRGRSLRDFLLQRRAMDLKSCLRVVAQVASALDYAHRRGIVHGELKPSNVLIDPDGWVHVSDLLVSRSLRPPPLPPRPAPSTEAPGEAPPAGETALAPARSPHAAPEDLRTPASDQYALAVMVTECLEGVPRGEPGEEIGAAPAPALANVPQVVTQAIQRALSEKPMDRFSNVLDFVAALETAPAVGAEARPSGRASGVVLRQTDWKPPGGGMRWRIVGAGVILLGAVAVGFWQWPAVSGLAQRLFGGQPAVGTLPMVADSAANAAPAPDTTPAAAVPAPPPPRVSGQRRPTARERRIAEENRRRRERAARERAAQAPTTPAEPGHLFVNATPWGQLYLDGQLVGNTPKANLTVAPGSHTLRVVREGFAPYQRTIEIAAGATLRVTDIVLTPLKP